MPALSPSGDRVAFGFYPPGAVLSLSIYDLDSKRDQPVIPESKFASVWPVWSPTGDRVAYISEQGGGFNTFVVAADGSGSVQQLTFAPDLRTGPTSWSVDNVLALEQGPMGQRDILMLSMDDKGEPQPFLVGEFHERGGMFSPDGRWLAFTSNRSGEDEVWVKPYPGDHPPVPISIGGGNEPVWSRDGRELFYRNGDRLMAVPIETTPVFRAGQPMLLFRGDYTYGYQDWTHNYDVAADGRFLMVKEGPVPKLQVIMNWFSELERLVPVD